MRPREIVAAALVAARERHWRRRMSSLQCVRVSRRAIPPIRLAGRSAIALCAPGLFEGSHPRRGARVAH